MKQDDSISPVWLVTALCPALAVSDMLAGGIALGAAAAIVCVTGVIAAQLLQRLPPQPRRTAVVLTLAALVSLLSLWLGAWSHELRGTLGVFLPLLGVNFAILRHADRTRLTAPAAALRLSLTQGLQILFILVVLGLARELVGRGSLLHGAGTVLDAWAGRPGPQLFPADMGFLLAMLPPGAFIAFGLLLAARNWITHRHEPGP